jgi:hypothetical protein
MSLHYRRPCDVCSAPATFTVGHHLDVEAGACRAHLADVVDQMYAQDGDEPITGDPVSVVPIRESFRSVE